MKVGEIMELDFYDVNTDLKAVTDSICYSLGDIFYRYSKYLSPNDEKSIQINLKLLKTKVALLNDIYSIYKSKINYNRSYAIDILIECYETTIRRLDMPSTDYSVELIKEQQERFLDVCDQLQKIFH